jgi:hypothetical protein
MTPMKKLTMFLLSGWVANAFASEPGLLERALSCKLKDKELPLLMQELSVQHPTLAAPVTQYGAPTADVYQLPTPVSALGYSSAEIVVTPARILLAVPNETPGQATGKLKLQQSPFSPASRMVRPTVSIVAFQLSHKALENKLLVGCEYANPAAAGWTK